MWCERIRIVLVVMVVMAIGAWIERPVSATEDSGWVGADTCKECHPQAYRIWVDSDHASANSALPEESRFDQKCTQCHGLSDSGKQSVQCESCHGSGQHYAKSYVMKDHVLARIVGLVDVSEKVCGRCHTDTVPNIRVYSYDQMWNLILHGQEIESGLKPPDKTS